MSLNEDTEKITESRNEELTFSELYASVMLNGEIVITIPQEEVERVKTGLKNLKAKQAAKMKEDGLIPDPSVFTFIERPTEDEEFEGYIDLSIQLSRRSVVKIAKMRIPDNEM
jgi:hypothetical protein